MSTVPCAAFDWRSGILSILRRVGRRLSCGAICVEFRKRGCPPTPRFLRGVLASLVEDGTLDCKHDGYGFTNWEPDPKPVRPPKPRPEPKPKPLVKRDPPSERQPPTKPDNARKIGASTGGNFAGLTGKVFTENFRPLGAEDEEVLYYRDAAKRVGITAARMRRRILKGVRRYGRTVWLEGWYDGRILYTTVQAIQRFMVACDTRPPSLPMPAETPHELEARTKHMLREAAQYGMFAEEPLCQECQANITDGWLLHREAPILCAGCLSKREDLPLGERFKARRLKIGLSQEELGARSGLSVTTIFGFETGRTTIRPKSLARLVSALDEEESCLGGLPLVK